jgi:hypothetical protein
MYAYINNLIIKFANWLSPTKRCGYCANPLEEQKYGIDGAMCDGCVAIYAPWALEPVDPLWLAIMSQSHGHYWGDPYNPLWDEPF